MKKTIALLTIALLFGCRKDEPKTIQLRKIERGSVVLDWGYLKTDFYSVPNGEIFSTFKAKPFKAYTDSGCIELIIDGESKNKAANISYP